MGATDIGWAMKVIQHGRLVTRKGWNGQGMFIGIEQPAAGILDVAFIFMSNADNVRVPWCPSQTDLLSEDWEEVQ